MSLLTAVPFSLSFNALVEVRVSAMNSAGYGPVSNLNTVGATIRSKPSQMNTPVRGSSSS
jgi:hypothetical protein